MDAVEREPKRGRNPVNLTILVPPELRKLVKLHALERDESVTDTVTRWVEEGLRREGGPGAGR